MPLWLNSLLTEWIASHKLMDKMSNDTLAQFLFAELQTGFRFSQIALSAQPDQIEQRARDAIIAWKADGSFVKYRKRVVLSPEQAIEVDDMASRLKSALRELGEIIEAD